LQNEPLVSQLDVLIFFAVQIVSLLDQQIALRFCTLVKVVAWRW
jgi:hypothetical protein